MPFVTPGDMIILRLFVSFIGDGWYVLYTLQLTPELLVYFDYGF